MRTTSARWSSSGRIGGYAGTFWVDNVGLRREGSPDNLLTLGTFDEPEWNRSFPAEGVGGSKCFKVVAKPDQTHRQQACWVVDKEPVPVEPGARYVVELDAKCDRMGSAEARPFVGLLLQDDGGEAPSGEQPLRVYASAQGGSLLSWPPVGARRDAAPPAQRAAAAECASPRATTAPGSRIRSWSRPSPRTATSRGSPGRTARSANGVVPHLAPRGHRVFLSIGWEAWGIPAAQREFAEAHEEIRALNFAGKREAHTACPTWLLSEGDAMLAEVGKGLLTAVADGDYAGANWDLEQPVVDPPHLLHLPALSRPPSAPGPSCRPTRRWTPRRSWSNTGATWTDFRCMQNAELAGRLRAMLRKSPHPVEFSLYSGYQCQRTKEHYGVDWAADAAASSTSPSRATAAAPRASPTRWTPSATCPSWAARCRYLSDRSDARPTPRYETWRNRLLRQFALSGGNGCPDLVPAAPWTAAPSTPPAKPPNGSPATRTFSAANNAATSASG